jgi:hypothetical protein
LSLAGRGSLVHRHPSSGQSKENKEKAQYESPKVEQSQWSVEIVAAGGFARIADMAKPPTAE